jgi:hypothetical protein
MRRTRVVTAVASAMLVITALSGCSVAGGYVEKGKKVIGADNMEDQYHRVITDYNSLQTSADNACAAQGGSEKSDDDPTLVEGPGLAYAATYRKIWVDYNSRMNNIFEAGYVGPPGYPRRIPNFTAGSKTDFCSVSDKLVQLKIENE